MDFSPNTSTHQSDRLPAFLAVVEMAILILMFAGVPLFVVPQAFESYQLPKFLLAEPLMLALIGLGILQTLLGRPFILPLNPALLVLGGYALLHAASILWAQSPSLAFDRSRFWLLLALTALFLPSAFARNAKARRHLGIALLLSAFFTAVWALTDDVRQAFFSESVHAVNKLGDWRGWIRAGFGNTSHIGDFLALMYPLGFLICLTTKRKSMFILMLFWLWIGYAALIVVFSVHSNVGLVVGMVVAVAGMWIGRARNPGQNHLSLKYILARLLALSLGWLLIAAFFSFDVPGNPHRPGIFREALGSDRLAFGWDSRVFIWLTGLEIVKQHPWLGVGSGNFSYVFPLTHSSLVLADPDLQWMAGSWTNAAHNSLLQSWSEVGVAGPALLILLFVFTFRSLGRNLRQCNPEIRIEKVALMSGLAAFAIHAQMNFPLQMATPMLLLILAVSMASLHPAASVQDALPLRMQHGWGSFHVTLQESMKPVLVSLELNRRPVLATIFLVLIFFPAIAFQGAMSHSKLQSDIAYRKAHNAHLEWMQFVAAGTPPNLSRKMEESADALFRRSLEYWPQHHDARSEYAEFLVRAGRGEEALAQIKITQQRLQSWELYLRRARAWRLLGQLQNARKMSEKAFAIKPVEAIQRPQLASWASGTIPLELAPPASDFQ